MRKINDTGTILIFLADSTTKSGKTGVASATVYYRKQGGVSTALATPVLTEIDATHMPGFYTITPSAGMVDTAGPVGYCVMASGCDNFNGILELDTNIVSDDITNTTEILTRIPDATAGTTGGLAIVGSAMTLTADYSVTTDDMAAAILATPANKIATDSSGQVTSDISDSLVRKILTNKQVESVDGTSVTIYDDDGTTALGTWSWSESTKTRGKLT